MKSAAVRFGRVERLLREFDRMSADWFLARMLANIEVDEPRCRRALQLLKVGDRHRAQWVLERLLVHLAGPADGGADQW